MPSPRLPVPGVAVNSMSRAGLALLTGVLALLSAAPAHAALERGSKIDVTYCAYGPGQVNTGHESPGFLNDEEGMAAITAVPAGLRGGHWQFTGQYPKARWFSYESFHSLASYQGFVNDDEVRPDPGSKNPYVPRRRWRRGQKYTVDVVTAKRAERNSPGTLYIGYQPNHPDVFEPFSLLLYSVMGATDPEQHGYVPVPRFYWVVDDPETTALRSRSEACLAIVAAGAHARAFYGFNKLSDLFIQPIEAPLLKLVPTPGPLDPVPTNPPAFTIGRPVKGGYYFPALFQNSSIGLVSPSAVFGKFLVVRFKAPTFALNHLGKPRSGREQTRWWEWTSGQMGNVGFQRIGALHDHQAHRDKDGYVTMVVSPPDQRPVIDGKPYPDWVEWPGSGGTLVFQQINENRATYPQGPYFMPPTMFGDTPYLGEYVSGSAFKDQIKAHMGAYYPQMSYGCTKAKFEAGGCRGGA